MPTPIVVPKLNENDDEVIVVELAVDAYVTPGQPLLSVETSKVVQEIEAEVAGFILWRVRIGDRVSVLSDVGWVFATEEERDAWSADRKPAEVAEATGSESRIATEPARRLAEQLGVSLDDVPAAGIVRESDVRAFAERTRPEEAPAAPAEPQTGKLSDGLRERLRNEPDAIKQLPSAEKVALYREYGAAIGEGVTMGRGALIDAEYVEIGDETAIGEDVLVRARRFSVGQLGQIGATCRFFCRDFVAGDVVTLRWNVVVVDGQGGIHDCHVGDLSFIAYDTYLNTDRDVRLGERVCLSPGARIYTHRKWLEALDGYPFSYAPVTIDERCWLGPGSLILPGVVLEAEVTVMANSVVASNVPRGALVGGVPAAVVKKRQKQELDPAHRDALLAEILGGNREALAVLGWALERGEGEGVWSGSLAGNGIRCRVLVVRDAAGVALPAGERAVLIAWRNGQVVEPDSGLTVFDLEAKTVRGVRDGASDVVRHLLFKYGMVFEPRLWRFGARLDQQAYR
jgi:acetyltransferase-like isoleucine patch superfamily enzyme